MDNIDTNEAEVTIKRYITNSFLNSFTSIHQLEVYNPFTFFTLLDQKNTSLSEKIQRLGSNIKDVDITYLVDDSKPNYYLKTVLHITKAYYRLLKSPLRTSETYKEVYDRSLINRFKSYSIFEVTLNSKEPNMAMRAQLKYKGFFDSSVWRALKWGAVGLTLAVCSAYLISLLPFSPITLIAESITSGALLNSITSAASTALGFTYSAGAAIASGASAVGTGLYAGASVVASGIYSGFSTLGQLFSAYRAGAFARNVVSPLLTFRGYCNIYESGAQLAAARLGSQLLGTVLSYTLVVVPILTFAIPYIVSPTVSFLKNAFSSIFFKKSQLAKINEVKDEKENQMFETSMVKSSFYGKSEDKGDLTLQNVMDLRLTLKRFLKANRKSLQTISKEFIDVKIKLVDVKENILKFANYNSTKQEKQEAVDKTRKTELDAKNEEYEKLSKVINDLKFKKNDKEVTLSDLGLVKRVSDDVANLCSQWSTDPYLDKLEISSGKRGFFAKIVDLFNAKPDEKQALANDSASEDLDLIFKDINPPPERKFNKETNVFEDDETYKEKILKFRKDNYEKLFKSMQQFAVTIYNYTKAVETTALDLPGEKLDNSINTLNELGNMYTKNFVPINKNWIFETDEGDKEDTISELFKEKITTDGVKTTIEKIEEKIKAEFNNRFYNGVDGLMSIDFFLKNYFKFDIFETITKSKDKTITPVMDTYKADLIEKNNLDKNKEAQTFEIDRDKEDDKLYTKDAVPTELSSLYSLPFLFIKVQWEDILDNVNTVGAPGDVGFDLVLNELPKNIFDTRSVDKYEAFTKKVYNDTDSLDVLFDALKIISLRNILYTSRIVLDNFENVVVVPSGRLERQDNFSRMFKGIESDFMLISNPESYGESMSLEFKKVNSLYDPKAKNVEEKLKKSNIDKIEDQLIGIYSTPGIENIILVKINGNTKKKITELLKIDFDFPAERKEQFFLINDYSNQSVDTLVSKIKAESKDNKLKAAKDAAKAFINYALLGLMNIKTVNDVDVQIGFVNGDKDVNEAQKKACVSLLKSLPYVCKRLFDSIPIKLEDELIPLVGTDKELKDYEKAMFYYVAKSKFSIHGIEKAQDINIDYNYTTISALAQYLIDYSVTVNKTYFWSEVCNR